MALLLAGTSLAAPRAAGPGSGPSSSEARVAREREVLLEGTDRATGVWTVTAPRPGPTVVIVGGVHGNEPAGARAAEQILEGDLRRGRLVVIPRANGAGLRAGTRGVPGEEAERADLNRTFPRGPGDRPRGELAEAIWRVVSSARPEWLLDLHEGFEFTRRRPDSVGSSVIAGPSAEARSVAERLVAAVNATIDDPERKFVTKRSPARGSLARAAAERLGARSLILETTSRAQPLSRRARQHRVMVSRLLEELGMADRSLADRLVGPGSASGAGSAGGAGSASAASLGSRVGYAIALWDGAGAAPDRARAIEAFLAARPGITVRRAGPEDVRAGSLGPFRAVVFGPGSGSRQGRALGPEGREAVRAFVRAGGAFVGWGAGAYLASSGYDWSLGLLGAEVVDRASWRRGSGTVRAEWTASGRALLALGGAAGRPSRAASQPPPPPASARAPGSAPAPAPAATRPLLLEFRNGAILAPGGRPGAGSQPRSDFRPLARFVTPATTAGASPSLEAAIEGYPAVVLARYGRGSAFVASVRLLETPSGREVLARVLDAVEGGKGSGGVAEAGRAGGGTGSLSGSSPAPAEVSRRARRAPVVGPPSTSGR